jgi:phage antirepressor YoqD-like protein
MDTLMKQMTMSSREIAELTGKEHRNVTADCDKLNESYHNLGIAEISAMNYKADNGQFYREYHLTRIQCLDLMTGYNTELRIKVNRRWEELEKRPPSIATLSRKDLALMIIQSEEENERLQNEVQSQTQRTQMLEGEKALLETENKQLAPKAEYTDKVLQSTSTYTMTQVAKELGMSAVALERKLHEEGVMFKQSGQWILYSKYQDKGYTKSRTHHYTHGDGTTGTNTITVWTESGRAFVHQLNGKEIYKF